MTEGKTREMRTMRRETERCQMGDESGHEGLHSSAEVIKIFGSVGLVLQHVLVSPRL
jgi:hypothetical protein